MKTSTIIKFFTALLTILSVIWFIYLFIDRGSKPSLVRKTKTVTRMDLNEKISIVGNVEPEKKTIITAPFDGYVQRMYVKIGDKVKKNAPIVSLRETLQSFNQVYYPIRVPFSGTVVQVLKEEGEFVTKNNVEDYLVRIDKLDNLYIEFDIPELYRLKIKPGQKAIIKISTILNKQYRGVIESVSLSAKHQVSWRENDNIEFESKAKILDIDENIHPGMSAVIDIISAEKKQALVLPNEFISRKNNTFFVVMENNQKRDIRVGIQNESYFEITDGLQEGDKVKQMDSIDIL